MRAERRSAEQIAPRSPRGAPAPQATGFRLYRGAAGYSRRDMRSWYLLLVIPLIGVLIPTIYNRPDPELAGIPFFYWYQMLWIPLSVAITVLVYVKTREPQRGRDDG